jgi:tetratricopeptide (TPR) repeat protein
LPVLLALIIMLLAPALGQTDTSQTGATYWFDKGMTYYILNNYSESIKAYDKALEINPQNDQAWNNKGIDLGILGRYDEAISAFNKATTINSSYAEAWYNMGVIYDLQGKYRAAIDAYNKATQINPEYQKALENKNADIDVVMAPTLSCGCSRQLPTL